MSHQGGEGLRAVPPADLLAFDDAATAIAHRHLDDRHTEAPELGRHLGAELEALALEVHASEELGTHELEARRFVGQRVTVDRVRSDGEDAIGGEVGGRHARGPATRQEAAAVDGVAPARERAEHLECVLDRVLEIGVLDEDAVAGRVREERADGRALAPIALVEEGPHRPAFGDEIPNRARRAVGGPVVANQDLALEPDRLGGARHDPGENLSDRRFFLEDRNQDGDAHELRTAEGTIHRSLANLVMTIDPPTRPAKRRPRATGRFGPRAVFVALLVVYSALFLARGVRDPGVADGFYAFMYARSLAWDGDVDFRNDYALCGDAFAAGVDRGTGHLDNPGYPGPAIAWVPLLTLARIVVPAAPNADAKVRDGCHGPRARFALAVAVPLAALAMALAARAAASFAGRHAASASALVFGVASSLPLYGAVFVSSSHVFEAFFAALLLYATARALEARGAARSEVRRIALLLFAAATGLVLQRLSDAALLAVPLAALFVAPGPTAPRARYAAAVGAGAALGIALMGALYTYLYGSPFVLPQGRHYVSFAHAHPWLVLFAPHGGLFYATPVAYLAVGGAILGLRRKRTRVVVAAALFASVLVLMVAAAPLDWHGKATFGARRLVVLVPLFVIAGAMALHRAQRWVRPLAARAALAGALVVALGGPVLGAIAGVTTGETPLEQPFGAPAGGAYRVVAAVGEIAIAPVRFLYAARFGLPASSFTAALTDRHYRRSYRDLSWEPNVVDFRDPALGAAARGVARTEHGLRMTEREARVAFTAGWHHADAARLRVTSERATRLAVRIVRPMGGCELGAQELSPGTTDIALIIPAGCFDSGLLGLTFRDDASDTPAGLTLSSLTLIDTRALPPPY